MRNRPMLATFLKVAVPFLVLIGALIVFLVVVAHQSLDINAKRETRTCTVLGVLTPSQGGGRTLDDGMPSWQIKTDCGGTLYIDPDATKQTAAGATALANSLRVGAKYNLTIQGQLGNSANISSYLLAAAPSAN